LRLIFRGMKSVELRKSRPRTTKPFLVDLYETKSDSGCGAVVGQCLCYCVARVTDLSEMIALQNSSCVTVAEMRKY
jgi:predicted transcriptional regulator